jgi:hypothetical protein
MASARKFLVICLAGWFSSLSFAQAQRVDELPFNPINAERKEGGALAQKKDYVGALARFRISIRLLEELKKQKPLWYTAVAEECLLDSRKRVDLLTPLAVEQVRLMQETAADFRPPLQVMSGGGSIRETSVEKFSDDKEDLEAVEVYDLTLELKHQLAPSWRNREGKEIIDMFKSMTPELENEVLNDCVTSFLAVHQVPAFQ